MIEDEVQHLKEDVHHLEDEIARLRAENERLREVFNEACLLLEDARWVCKLLKDHERDGTGCSTCTKFGKALLKAIDAAREGEKDGES